MTEHLLLISLGPVQEFIASARRSNDLWFGSWLLSELSRTTAATVAGECGMEGLIFPATIEPDDDRGKPAVANKILVLVPAGHDPKAVAAQGRKAMEGDLMALADVAFRQIPKDRYFDEDQRERARRQVGDVIEWMWVAVPVEDARGDGAAYAAARARAERLLTARYHRRVWSQTAAPADGGWAAAVPKSSLDGRRESVFHEALYDALAGRPKDGFPPVQIQAAREQYFVGKTERLCGVGLLKRVGAEVDFDDERRRRTRPLFHSTSHIAAAPLRTRIGARGKHGAVDAYAAALFDACKGGPVDRLRLLRAPPGGVPITSPIKHSKRLSPDPIETPVALGESRLDGRAFYVAQLPALLDDFRPGFAEERNLARRNAVLDPLRDRLAALLRDVGLGVEGVPAYYATLLADGDSMGKALDRVGEVKGMAGHKALGAALDDFSLSCRRIVGDHAGSLVYAGGDDVLALLPLHTVLACARKLHDAFGARLAEALRELDVAVDAPTLSVGIGIAHHLDDMADARELARSAEHRAKGHPGKDALALCVQLRSGGQLSVVGGFAGGLDARVVEWAKLLLEEAIPDKAAHDLAAAMLPLLEGGGSAQLSEAARSLATRVLDRKRGERGAEPLSEKVRELVEDCFRDGDVARAVHGLAQELQLAALVAEALDVAFGKNSAPAAAPER